VYIGNTTSDAKFHDVVRHTADRAQSNTFCSSVDPWHEGAVINKEGDQVGLDLFYTSGITRGLPAMIPVAMLYEHLKTLWRSSSISRREATPFLTLKWGEEPDGKHTLPEDYGALYLQWATALHKVDPALKLGGPIFEGVNKDIEVWPDARGRNLLDGAFLRLFARAQSPE